VNESNRLHPHRWIATALLSISLFGLTGLSGPVASAQSAPPKTLVPRFEISTNGQRLALDDRFLFAWIEAKPGETLTLEVKVVHKGNDNTQATFAVEQSESSSGSFFASDVDVPPPSTEGAVLKVKLKPTAASRQTVTISAAGAPLRISFVIAIQKPVFVAPTPTAPMSTGSTLVSSIAQGNLSIPIHLNDAELFAGYASPTVSFVQSSGALTGHFDLANLTGGGAEYLFNMAVFDLPIGTYDFTVYISFGTTDTAYPVKLQLQVMRPIRIRPRPRT
jgi:hypothetical protein